MKPQNCVFVAASVVALAMTSCSRPSPEFDRQFSLGSSGSFLVDYDNEERLENFRYVGPDGAEILSGRIDYLGRKMERCDVSRVSIMDPKGVPNLVSDFAGGSTSSTGSLGLDYEWHSSGMPGDIHNRYTWRFQKDVLLQILRYWPDDLSTVTYEFTGPQGIVLYTNRYVRN